MSEDRKQLIKFVKEAQSAGARQSKACEIIGISVKTLQRWEKPDNAKDSRTEALREPANKLTEAEYQQIIHVVNDPKYADLPPGKLVPTLLDEGLYIGSESTVYRVMK
ncbi:MAG: putative transposase, partial [Alteromonadaceae bacterium]